MGGMGRMGRMRRMGLIGAVALAICLGGCATRSGEFLWQRTTTVHADGSTVTVEGPDLKSMREVSGPLVAVVMNDVWGLLANAATSIGERLAELVGTPVKVVDAATSGTVTEP